jgi:phage terminase large subunit-like protein
MPLEAILDEWDDGGWELSIQRAHDYAACVAAGEPCDWQYECVMRIFGWVRYSDDWGREVRRFRKGGVWCPKKSKKSPTLSAIGLYLMIGDGEPGQKVFFAAKDGTQAREIAGQHALEMVKASKELDAACEINMSRMRITYTEARSFLQPLSSGSSRSVEAKEGLNGSILIDETHVVDREYAATISRAGISRAEPLFLQFSTAGKDPDSYGKEEFDYGEENNRTGADESYFFAYYGVDQTLSDEAIAADPEGALRQANPAMGHTVHMTEALADYHASKANSKRFADFKTYRLNIWQQSANPWIRMDDWSACGQDFTEESLYGQPCGAGLDLGKVSDMTALSLVFPENMESWTRALSSEIETPVNNEAPLSAKTPGDSEPLEILEFIDLSVKVLTWYWLPDAVL